MKVPGSDKIKYGWLIPFWPIIIGIITMITINKC